MIGGVLLAAGEGSRFRAAGGGIKLLAPVDGRPLVERALAALAAAPLGDRVIVLGAHGDEVLAAIDLHGARPVRNERWERGLASSLRAGLDALDPACTAALVVLGDDHPVAEGDRPRGRRGRGCRRPSWPPATGAAATATRSRSRARSGRSSRARANVARVHSASRRCSSTAATCPRPATPIRRPT